MTSQHSAPRKTSTNEPGVPRLVTRLKVANVDPYLAFAAEMFRKDPKEVSDEERQAAKERVMTMLYTEGRSPEEMLKEAASLIIQALGRDSKEEGLKGTPDRVAKAWVNEFTPGILVEDALSEMIIEESYDQMLIVKGIPISSFCEHHLLPWFGNVAVGYIPHELTVGLSKLTRMVQAAQKGITIQERVTETLANAMQKVLKPSGSMVVIEATHSCTAMRGVKSEGQSFTTSAVRGIFLSNPHAKQEFLTLLNRS